MQAPHIPDTCKQRLPRIPPTVFLEQSDQASVLLTIQKALCSLGIDLPNSSALNTAHSSLRVGIPVDCKASEEACGGLTVEEIPTIRTLAASTQTGCSRLAYRETRVAAGLL